ncbi:MAG: copper resistance protein NlpE [Methylococcaceae bacterium]|nr:copper resistance protein NlpE [Methylococcaceae bacterium]
MQTIKKQLKQNVTLLLFSALLIGYTPVMAESDQAAVELYQKARGKSVQQEEDHSAHADSTKAFHGVFYGFTPCDNCLGTKMTLRLNPNNNYLLVIQSTTLGGAKETYEKGKYVWDDEKHTVELTPRKGAKPRHYYIQDHESLALLNDDGTKITNGDADRYVLRRSDTVKTREIHFH